MNFEIGDAIILIKGMYKGDAGVLSYRFEKRPSEWLVHTTDGITQWHLTTTEENFIKIKDLTELEKLIYNCK